MRGTTPTVETVRRRGDIAKPLGSTRIEIAPIILDWSRRIDRGPFATLAAGERITFPNPEIGVVLSAAAAATERVSIAFSVLVLPMHSRSSWPSRWPRSTSSPAVA